MIVERSRVLIRQAWPLASLGMRSAAIPTHSFSGARLFGLVTFPISNAATFLREGRNLSRPRLGRRRRRRLTMATPALTGAALAQNRHQGGLREYMNQKLAPYLKKALKDVCDVE